MTVTDVYATVFEARGVAMLLSSYGKIAVAQGQVATAQSIALAGAQGLMVNYSQMWTNIAAAAGTAARILVYAGLVIGGIGVIIGGATKAYITFAKEIMNIRDLTGSTAREAVRAATLFRVAGVSDIQAIRDVMRLSQTVFGSQGQAALGMLGIPASPNVKGVELFNQIADALDRMEPGLRKTQIIEQIFGLRGTAAIMPLLRLTKEQREAAADLADSFDTKLLPAAQSVQAGMSILGMTLEMKVIFPIVQRLLPVIQRLINWMAATIDILDRVDKALGRFPSWVLTVLALSAAFGGVALGIKMAWSALVILNRVALITIMRMIALLALSGPKGWAILAGAVGVAAAAGAAMYMMQPKESDEDTRAGQTMNDAADKMNDAATIFHDAATQYNKGGMPFGWGPQDANAAARNLALGAIG